MGNFVTVTFHYIYECDCSMPPSSPGLEQWSFWLRAPQYVLPYTYNHCSKPFKAVMVCFSTAYMYMATPHPFPPPPLPSPFAKTLNTTLVTAVVAQGLFWDKNLHCLVRRLLLQFRVNGCEFWRAPFPCNLRKRAQTCLSCGIRHIVTDSVHFVRRYRCKEPRDYVI